MAELVLDAEEMRALDRLAIETLGIPSLVLMESAGRQVAEHCHRLLRPRSKVLVLAGVGNNGGDGLVVARALDARAHRVRVLVIGDEARGSADFLKQLELGRQLGLSITSVDVDGFDDAAERALIAEIKDADLLVDAIFGTGLSRPLGSEMLRIISATDLSPGPTVSVDVPSGIDASTGQELGGAVHADLTVTFQVPKLGLLQHPGRQLAGRLEVVDIGIPLALATRLPKHDRRIERLGPEDLDEVIEPRPPDAHKGDFGHVFVVAGTPDRPGSALLAARAASRVGAGLVTLGSDDETVRRLAPSFLELMGASLGAGAIERARLQAELAGKDALVLGPSLSPPELAAWLSEFLAQVSVPTVLDAGALGALALARPRPLARAEHIILTPHPGEAASLLGLTPREVQADRLAAVKRLATETGCTIVLKGASTLIAGPTGPIALVDRGGPGLATAGTGDVLAGTIGGLCARGFSPFHAARAGVLLHAIAGERATLAEGEHRVVASDLLHHLMRDLGSAST